MTAHAPKLRPALMALLVLSCAGGAQTGDQQAAEDEPASGLAACDLLTEADAARLSGLTITGHTPTEHPGISSCWYASDQMFRGVGITVIEPAAAGTTSEALAADLQAEFTRDEAPYTAPEPVAGMGIPVARYREADGDSWFYSGYAAPRRIAVSAPGPEASRAVFEAVLARLPGS